MKYRPTDEDRCDAAEAMMISAAMRARAKKRRPKKKPSKLVGSGRLVGGQPGAEARFYVGQIIPVAHGSIENIYLFEVTKLGADGKPTELKLAPNKANEPTTG